MNRLITESVNEGDIAKLHINPIGKIFSDVEHEIKMSVCGDPTCHCGAANITIIKKESPEKNIIEYNIALDVNEKNIHSKDHREFFSRDENGDYIIDVLNNGLTPEDWAILKKHYLQHKFKIIEEVKASDVNFEFSEEEYKDISLMFPYQVIFPCALFEYKYEKEKYAILESYCKNPECSCSNTILNVYPISENKDGVIKNLGAYHYDYTEKKGWADGEDNSKIESIVQGVFSKYDNIDKLFRRRNKILREIYATARHRYNIKMNKRRKLLSNKKVGRNELCPCGSGKKYKKCCLEK